MDWVRVLYLVSVVILWVCIGVNFWNIGRNRQLRKKWEKMISELERIYNEHISLRDRYIELLDKQREEVSDEGNNDDNG